jgi:hypothetical protein
MQTLCTLHIVPALLHAYTSSHLIQLIYSRFRCMHGSPRLPAMAAAAWQGGGTSQNDQHVYNNAYHAALISSGHYMLTAYFTNMHMLSDDSHIQLSTMPAGSNYPTFMGYIAAR